MVTFSEEDAPPAERLHGLAPSTISTSTYFADKFVPVVKGRLTRPPLSDALTTIEFGGNLKKNRIWNSDTYSSQ